MADLPRCTFKTVIRDFRGRGLGGVKFFVQVHSGIVGGDFIQPYKFDPVTNSGGLVSFSLVQGAQATISGNHPSFQKPRTITVPAQSSYDLMLIADLAAGVVGTTFDTGSVLFTDSGGLIKQDASNLHYDDATNSLQLGGTLRMGEIAEPATPAANTGLYFVKDEAGLARPFFKGSDGTVIALGGTISNPALAGALTANLSVTAGALQRALDGTRDLYIGTGTAAMPIIAAAAVEQFGAVADGVVVQDGAMSLGGFIVTCASAPFFPECETMLIDVNRAGATQTGGVGDVARNNIVGEILEYISPTQVRISVEAAAIVTGRQVVFGTDNSAAFQAAIDSGAKAVRFLDGIYCCGAQLDITDGNVTFYGAGPFATSIYSVGPIRMNAPSVFNLFHVHNGASNVHFREIGLLGTNHTGLDTINGGATADGVYIDIGATGARIYNVTATDCRFDEFYGIGFHNPGDASEGGGFVDPFVRDIHITNCYANYNGADGFNPNPGRGVQVRGCVGTHNRTGGIEAASSEGIYEGNYFCDNGTVGMAIGGYGDPSIARKSAVIGNVVLRNGTNGISASGNQKFTTFASNIIIGNGTNGGGAGVLLNTDGSSTLGFYNFFTGNLIADNSDIGVLVQMFNGLFTNNWILNTDGNQVIGVVVNPGATGNEFAFNTVRNHVSQDYALAAAISYFALGSSTIFLDIGGAITYLDATFGTVQGTFAPFTSAGTARFGVDVSAGDSITILNNGTATPFGNANNFSGRFTISEDQSFGRMAEFMTIQGNMVKGMDAGSSFTTTLDNASTINVYLVSNVVTIQNKTGSTIRLKIFAERLRNANV